MFDGRLLMALYPKIANKSKGKDHYWIAFLFLYAIVNGLTVIICAQSVKIRENLWLKELLAMMNRLVRNKLLVLPVLFGILISCTPGTIYEKHVKMENLAWNRFDTVAFNVPIKDTDHNYDIIITIRHITDIPYRKLEVYFDFTTPDGESRIRKIKIPIKDESGKNLGDGMGELWDLEVPAWQGFRFSKPGNCKFELTSAMSHLNLIGIIEVGLIVRKSRK